VARRRKTWRFRLDEATTLAVSAAGPTERQIRRRGRWSLVVGTLIAALMMSAVAGAAVWTDQQDYSPGSVVTISGDNSDDAGYFAGESVSVAVSGPNGFEASCGAEADTDGVWSCQVTLWDSLDAVGEYAYTATGQTSGVSESGTFTDAINIESFASDCTTGSSSFTVGATVCAKATGLPGGGGGSSGRIEWWAPSGASATRTTNFTGESGNFTDSFAPSACGTWTLKVYSPAATFQDDDTFEVTGCAPVNSAPVVTANNESFGEGTSETYSASWTDADSGQTHTCTIDFGDGGAAVAGTVSPTQPSTSGTCSASHTYADGPNSYTITVRVSDGTATGSDTALATVNNVKPSVTIDSVSGNSGAACIAGNQVTLGFSWTDPAGANDTYSYDVNWGDGSAHTTASNATSPVSNLTHTYAAGGPYTLVVTVNDEDAGAGGTASSSEFSFLYNVSGVLQPVNDTQAQHDPSVFKYGSTLPVKIRVTDCDNVVVPGLAPQISVRKISGSTPPSGIDEPIVSTSGADSGTTMRYSDGIYIYNLATKSLADSSATYEIKITGPFTTVTTMFGTRPK